MPERSQAQTQNLYAPRLARPGAAHATERRAAESTPAPRTVFAPRKRPTGERPVRDRVVGHLLTTEGVGAVSGLHEPFDPDDRPAPEPAGRHAPCEICLRRPAKPADAEVERRRREAEPPGTGALAPLLHELRDRDTILVVDRPVEAAAGVPPNLLRFARGTDVPGRDRDCRARGLQILEPRVLHWTAGLDRVEPVADPFAAIPAGCKDDDDGDRGRDHDGRERRGCDDEPPSPGTPARLLDQRLELLLRGLSLWRGFDDRHEMKLVVLAPSIDVKNPRPRDAAGPHSPYRGRKRRGGIVGRLGSLVVLASMALAFVAVALTAFKA